MDAVVGTAQVGNMTETSSTGATSASDLDLHGLVRARLLDATADDLAAGPVIVCDRAVSGVSEQIRRWGRGWHSVQLPDPLAEVRASFMTVQSAALASADPARPQPNGSG